MRAKLYHNHFVDTDKDLFFEDTITIIHGIT
jgi:hypothetical protein